MNKLSINKTGIALGSFFAFIHLIWSIMVWTGLARTWMNWILKMHFLSLPYAVRHFSVLTAIELIVLTAIVGYVIGVVFAWFWNWIHK